MAKVKLKLIVLLLQVRIPMLKQVNQAKVLLWWMQVKVLDGRNL
jgi:hypothetical protein